MVLVRGFFAFINHPGIPSSSPYSCSYMKKRFGYGLLFSYQLFPQRELLMSKKNIKSTATTTADSFIESLKNDLSSNSSTIKESKKGKKASEPLTVYFYDKKKLYELESGREGVIYNLIDICTMSRYVEEMKHISSYAYYTDDKTFNVKDAFLKIVGLASMVEEDVEHFNRFFHRKLDRYDKEIVENYGKEALAGLGAQIEDVEGE